MLYETNSTNLRDTKEPAIMPSKPRPAADGPGGCALSVAGIGSGEVRIPAITRRSYSFSRVTLADSLGKGVVRVA